MPIRPELRPLYPPHWRELSGRVRFKRAGGKCQRCGRPHLTFIRCLPDGRWFDEQAATWRDRRGRMARWPDLVEATRFRITRVVLAAAHLDGDPTNNRLKNLRAFCQRCHMLHDRPHHLAQRWITYRRRLAVGDLFLGPYPCRVCNRAHGAGPAQRHPRQGRLNPVEYLWAHWKHHELANFCPKDFAELSIPCTRQTPANQRRKTIVAAFRQQAELPI